MVEVIGGVLAYSNELSVTILRGRKCDHQRACYFRKMSLFRAFSQIVGQLTCLFVCSFVFFFVCYVYDSDVVHSILQHLHAIHKQKF